MATDDPGGNLAIKNAAVKSCRQNITEHDKRFFVSTGWNMIQACIGMRGTHEFSLCAVNLTTKTPAASRAMGEHSAPAVIALAAGRHAGDQDAVADLEGRHASPDRVDDAGALMSEDASRLARRNVALENVQVSTADGGLDHFDERIAGCAGSRAWAGLRAPFAPALCRQRRSWHSPAGLWCKPMLRSVAAGRVGNCSVIAKNFTAALQYSETGITAVFVGQSKSVRLDLDQTAGRGLVATLRDPLGIPKDIS